MQPVASTRHTLIVVAILTVVSLATWRANVNRGSSAPQSRMSLYAGAIVAEAALAFLIVRGLRGTTVRELIGRPRVVDVLLAAAFWAGSRLLIAALKELLGAHDNRVGGLVPVTLVEKALWLAVAIAAGIVEELVYRGYLQRQFGAWTGSRAAGVVSQALMFGASHGYQGWRSMVVIAAYGVLFGALAEWRRSLVPGMIAHAWTDIAGGLGI